MAYFSENDDKFADDDDDIAPLNDTSQAVKKHRNSFIKTAPSLMRLLSMGTLTKASSEPINSFITVTDEVGKTEHLGNTLNDSQYSMGRNRNTSVVNHVLAEYEKNAKQQHNDQMDMELLATKAAEEFQKLAQQNDDLFKEKEQYRQKYDDLERQCDGLKDGLRELALCKEEKEDLAALNAKLQSEAQILEEQTRILQESVNDLKMELAATKNIEQQNNAMLETCDISSEYEPV